MKNNKYFIITIDTEADDQWDTSHECTTNNAQFLPRFQELCEKYEYKPVWLTTYEMTNDNFFVNYFKDKQDKELCEIGMHLHAWNNPPEYEIKKITNERSYLIEYPVEIMEEKIKVLDDALLNKFGIKAVSHRAGRWATNEDYFDLLSKYGYKVDCSVTPHINWKNSLGETGISGSNYENSLEKPYIINNNLLEVPVTIKIIRLFEFKRIINVKKLIREIQFLIKGKKQWIRPDSLLTINGMKKVIDECSKNNEYIMFMIHSSELMPAGSPNFKTEENIEELYKVIEFIFDYTKRIGYSGITLKDFYKKYNGGEY